MEPKPRDSDIVLVYTARKWEHEAFQQGLMVGIGIGVFAAIIVMTVLGLIIGG